MFWFTKQQNQDISVSYALKILYYSYKFTFKNS